MDESTEDIPNHLKFPRTVNEKKWIQYLGRPLSWKEKYILEEVKMEKYMNDRMKDLYEKCKSLNWFVPLLTNLNGNCLFESLVHHGVGDSIGNLRKGFGHLMFIFKNFKDFLPGVDISLEEMYDLTNDIEYVSAIVGEKEDRRRVFYKYSYNVMCKDLTNLYSWNKLPTELIIRVMSFMFNLEFIILHDNGHVTKINVYSDQTELEKPKLQTILLGLIGESHYVPIDVLAEDEEIEPMYYNEAKIAFLTWAREMEKLEVASYYDRLNRLKNYRNIEKEMDRSDDENSSKKYETIDMTSIVNPESGSGTTTLINFAD